ncbi:MAG: hypothetical protein ACPGVX_01470, partial [Thalassobaculaceae bacterium]
WAEARPLITTWMIEHRGPAARVAKTAAALSRLVDHLPRWVDRLERAARAPDVGAADADRADAPTDPLARGPAWLWAALLLTALLLIAAKGL